MFQSVSNKPLHQMEQTLVTIWLCLSSSYYMIFVPFGHSHMAAMVNSAIWWADISLSSQKPHIQLLVGINVPDLTIYRVYVLFVDQKSMMAAAALWIC